MTNKENRVKIGMFDVEEILKLKAPGVRGPTVAELLLQQCRSSEEFDDEPAYLIEIDGSYMDVYEVEGEPMEITIRYAGDEHEPDRATPHNQAEGDSESEYTFRDRTTARPSTIQPCDAFATKVVAIAGPNNNWAAYEGPSHWPDEKVARQGIKLPQRQAELLFYVMRAPGRHYGDPRNQVRADDIRWHSLEDKLTIRPCDIQGGDAFTLKVVAVAGFGNDWAAYEGPSDWADDEVARQGNKLSPEQVEPLFPVMHATGRYYRL